MHSVDRFRRKSSEFYSTLCKVIVEALSFLLIQFHLDVFYAISGVIRLESNSVRSLLINSTE